MRGYNFTERMRRVLGEARNEAVALRHEYVGSEHMLLGLLSDDGVASAVLQNLGVELPHVRQVVKQTIRPGKVVDLGTNARDLPFTSRAKKVLEYAMSQARELNHMYVGTEHLLLGLLLEGQGIAAAVLQSFGVTFDNTRAETMRILGTDITADPRHESPTGEKPIRVNLVLEYSNRAVVSRSFTDVSAAARFLTAQ